MCLCSRSCCCCSSSFFWFWSVLVVLVHTCTIGEVIMARQNVTQKLVLVITGPGTFSNQQTNPNVCNTVSSFSLVGIRLATLRRTTFALSIHEKALSPLPLASIVASNNSIFLHYYSRMDGETPSNAGWSIVQPQ